MTGSRRFRQSLNLSRRISSEEPVNQLLRSVHQELVEADQQFNEFLHGLSLSIGLSVAACPVPPEQVSLFFR
jgi:hypothetical protein